MIDGKRISLVLGGGGMKGLAHIGALKALKRYGIIPDEYVGTSVGSLVCALAAGGMPPHEIEEVGLHIRKEDILDYDWWSLIIRRSRTRSIYKGKAYHDFVRRVLPVDRFDQLKSPLYITSVDLTRGQEVIWGMPGLTQVPIHDCVVASSSIPGIYPPKRINRYYFADGSLVDTLPIKVSVYNKADLIIGVFLEAAETGTNHAQAAGMGAILMQSQSVLSKTLFKHNLRHFDGAPLVLIQPRVPLQSMFQFDMAAEVIAEGERATEEVLRNNSLLRPLLAALPQTPTPYFATKPLIGPA